MADTDGLSDTAALIVGLEDWLRESPAYQAKPRGWCGACGFHVQLTPAGYLKSHSYIMRAGQRVSLFSWRAILVKDKDTPSGAILRCSGGGNRPRKTEPAHAQV
jgi:hypothetical protein